MLGTNHIAKAAAISGLGSCVEQRDHRSDQVIESECGPGMRPSDPQPGQLRVSDHCYYELRETLQSDLIDVVIKHTCQDSILSTPADGQLML